MIAICYNLILFSPLFAFFHFGGVNYLFNVYSNILRKIHEFQEMKRSQQVSYPQLLKNIIFALYSLTLYTISQKLNQNVERLDKHTYLVKYLLAGQIYKIKVKAKKGMSPVEKVINEKDEIVTDDVMMYAGPNFDWHQHSYTPISLGYEKLTFYYFLSEETDEFTGNDELKIRR